MDHTLDEERTEGPEGYFVQSRAVARPQLERRARRPGRRHEDAELRRARSRLVWAYATFSAVLAAAMLIVAVTWID